MARKIKTQEELLIERRDRGKLPTIDIAGHMFYVDTRMEALRPHDDFTTRGIPFYAFKIFAATEDVARIPYSPSTHSIRWLDFQELEKLTAFPKDWVMIEIQYPWKLDPYGFARDNHLDIMEHIKKFPLRDNMKAKVLSWQELGLADVIKRNKEKKNGVQGRAGSADNRRDSDDLDQRSRKNWRR